MKCSYIDNVSVVSIFIGTLPPLLIPLLHFGVVSKLWDKYSFAVDIYNCRNTCWDTVFKGKNKNDYY